MGETGTLVLTQRRARWTVGLNPTARMRTLAHAGPVGPEEEGDQAAARACWTGPWAEVAVPGGFSSVIFFQKQVLFCFLSNFLGKFHPVFS